jgi:hypothetical protein
MTLFIAGVAIAALALMIGIEIAVIQNRKKPPRRTRHRHARRQPLLEDRLRDVLDEPRAQYGEVFTSFTIWKREQETRMELISGDPWSNLNDFTRALVVRHVWRALEKLAKGSIVVIDRPAQEWSEQIDRSFDDRGIDPWAEGAPAAASPGAPSQFIRDR